ncbi:MAG TPA: hypothetical protein VFU47_00075, partial [Armatimonadota bacterium]|nr:hypothetical protein [Armatimonadota bacterium]
LALDDGETAAALIAADLMYLDAAFTASIREQVAAETPIPPENVLVAASHSHNAPNAATVRGVGERDEAYLEWAARQCAAAAVEAWRERRPVTLRAGHVDVAGPTFNRTRDAGPVDARLTVLRGDSDRGTELLAVNFAAHPTAMMEWDRFAVSRDYPGVMIDAVERALPGCRALFFQGSCGDLNFRPEFSREGRWYDAGVLTAGAALQAAAEAAPVPDAPLRVRRVPVRLPTRRYERAEVEREREVALHFARNPQTTEGWREVLGRVNVGHPERFPDRYGNDERKAVDALVRFTLGWTEEILKDLETRDPWVDTEAWGLRLGPFALAANGAELFSHWALELRERTDAAEVMVVGYANDAISYVPDAHDIEKGTYAAAQSPKYMGRFPFTVASGEALTQAMNEAVGAEA